MHLLSLKCDLLDNDLGPLFPSVDIGNEISIMLFDSKLDCILVRTAGNMFLSHDLLPQNLDFHIVFNRNGKCKN